MDAGTGVEWAAFDGPDSYEPDRVPAALASLANAGTESDAQRAYDRVLAAIGNNHAGTIYPAAIGAVPIIARIARESANEWARWSAGEVLTELTTTFQSEPGYETTRLPSGVTADLEATVAVLAGLTTERNRDSDYEPYPFVGTVRWIHEPGPGGSARRRSPHRAVAFIGRVGMGSGVASVVVSHSGGSGGGPARGRWLLVANEPPFEVELATSCTSRTGYDCCHLRRRESR